MADIQRVTHNGPPDKSGQSLSAGERLANFGYAWNAHFESVAFVPSQSGAAAVQQWYSAASFDFAAMQNDDYEEVGIGLSNGYICVIYGKPRVKVERLPSGYVPLMKPTQVSIPTAVGEWKPTWGNPCYKHLCGTNKCYPSYGTPLSSYNGVVLPNSNRFMICVPHKDPAAGVVQGEANGKLFCSTSKPTNGAEAGAVVGRRRTRRGKPVATATPLTSKRSAALDREALSNFVASYHGEILALNISMLGVYDLEVELVETTSRLFHPGGTFGANMVDGNRVDVVPHGNRWFVGAAKGHGPGSRVHLGLRKNGDIKATLQWRKSNNRTIAVDISTDPNGLVAVIQPDDPEDFDFSDKTHKDGVEEDYRVSSHRHPALTHEQQRARRDAVPFDTCSMFLDADKWFFDKWAGSGTMEDRVDRTVVAMLDMSNAMMDIFHLNFGSDGGPFVFVVGIAVHPSEEMGVVDPTALNNKDLALKYYSAFLKKDAFGKQGRLRSDSNTRTYNGTDWGRGTKGNDVCLNHLFTHTNYGKVIGVATLGGICSTTFNNVGFTSTRSKSGDVGLSARQTTTAHEVGHNFGANHDCSNDHKDCQEWLKLPGTPDIEDECLKNDEPFLMFPESAAGMHRLKFSSCSRYYIKKTMSSHAGTTCFIQSPINIPVYIKPRNTTTTTFVSTTADPILYHEYHDNGTSFVGEFDYVDAATPRLTSLFPTSGTQAQRITIKGVSLATATEVRIGKYKCTNTEVTGPNAQGDDIITCDVPRLSAGKYHLAVQTRDMGLAAHPLGHKNNLHYISELELASIEPRDGSWLGGTKVTCHENVPGTCWFVFLHSTLLWFVSF